MMGCCNRRLCFQVFLGIFQGLLVLTQGSLLNFYIISEFSATNTTYFFFLGDFICIFVFAGTISIAFRYLAENEKQQKTTNNSFMYSPKRLISNYSTSKFGVLPLIYLSWTLYALLLLSKIAVIFTSEIPQKISTKQVAGPQLLKLAIALSGVIFLVLVEGHNWAEVGSPKYTYVNSVCFRTGVEILDSVSFLSIIMSDSPESLLGILTPNFISVIVAISGVNFLLPILILYKLSLGERYYEKFPLPITSFHSLLHVLSIDLPFFTVRLYLWVKHGHNSSVFLMKNVFGILNALRTLYADIVLCCSKNKNRENEFLPSEKIVYVDEPVGDEEKIGEPMDEMKKSILQERENVNLEK